jgi:hypothetical protein
MKGTFKGHLEYREGESLTREVDDAKSPCGCFAGMARTARTSRRQAACLAASKRVMGFCDGVGSSGRTDLGLASVAQAS